MYVWIWILRLTCCRVRALDGKIDEIQSKNVAFCQWCPNEAFTHLPELADTCNKVVSELRQTFPGLKDSPSAILSNS